MAGAEASSWKNVEPSRLGALVGSGCSQLFVKTGVLVLVEVERQRQILDELALQDPRCRRLDPTHPSVVGHACHGRSLRGTLRHSPPSLRLRFERWARAFQPQPSARAAEHSIALVICP